MPYTELYHHGILGQKWGVRRFQNADGSLTSAGRLRYGIQEARTMASYITEPLRNRAGRLRSGIQETRDLASYIVEPLQNRTAETIVSGIYKADNAYKSLKTSAATLSNDIVKSASAVGKNLLSKLGIDNKSMDDVYSERLVSISDESGEYMDPEDYKWRANHQREYREGMSKLKKISEEHQRERDWKSAEYAQDVLEREYWENLRDVSKMTPDNIDSVYGSLTKSFNDNFTTRSKAIYEMLEGRRQALDIAQRNINTNKPYPEETVKDNLEYTKYRYKDTSDADVKGAGDRLDDKRSFGFMTGLRAGRQIETMSDAVNCCYELSTINSILNRYYGDRPLLDDYGPKYK